MQKIISEIINAEAEAQKITQDAAHMRAQLPENIKTASEKMRAERMTKAEQEINALLCAQKDELEKATSSAEAEYKKQADELEARYRENRDKWINDTFLGIIGK